MCDGGWIGGSDSSGGGWKRGWIWIDGRWGGWTQWRRWERCIKRLRFDHAVTYRVRMHVLYSGSLFGDSVGIERGNGVCGCRRQWLKQDSAGCNRRGTRVDGSRESGQGGHKHIYSIIYLRRYDALCRMRECEVSHRLRLFFASLRFALFCFSLFFFPFASVRAKKVPNSNGSIQLQPTPTNQEPPQTRGNKNTLLHIHIPYIYTHTH